jgi:hypothetical protein
MPLPIAARRLFWRLVLAYSIGSGAYALWVLATLLFSETGHPVPAAAIALIGTHVLLYPVAWFNWNAPPGEGWKGLMDVSDAARSTARRLIRLIAASLLVAVIFLAAVLRLLDVGRTEAGRALLPGIGIAAFVLFFSILYGVYSLLGKAVIVSPTLGPWEKTIMKVSRRLRARRRPPS